MNNQTHIPGIERRKKERVRLETSPPPRPISSFRLGWLIITVIVAVVGLVGLIVIFWMGVVGKV